MLTLSYLFESIEKFRYDLKRSNKTPEQKEQIKTQMFDLHRKLATYQQIDQPLDYYTYKISHRNRSKDGE